MGTQTFTDALMESKRRARLQGRTVSQQEAAGIAEGTAKSAQDKALQELSIRNQERQFGEQMSLQKDQFSAQRDQFAQQLGENRSQFGSTLGLKEREMATQESQFSRQLSTQKEQFDKDFSLKQRSFNEQQAQAMNQLDMARQTLAMQKEQFEKSSAAQKEQFGEQMKFQIEESAKKVDMFLKQLEENRYQFYATLQLQREQMNAQLQQAQASNDDSGGCCIIVTVATQGPKEFEVTNDRVDIARAYRDIFMGPTQLRGYYMFAEWLVPKMLKSGRIMAWIKKNIVYDLIPYCGWRIGANMRPPLNVIIRTKLFLWMCSCVGATKTSFTRLNGEVL
ncbi:MAG TPA: hypothetical protein VLH56_16425 [Dissulfurispiraceae bacterium]|nr:hypothetical protein [Dissulfurispiraceae bacterium]